MKTIPSLFIYIFSVLALSSTITEGYWVTIYGSWAYIAGENVNLRSDPNTSSAIIETLNSTDRISILKINTVAETINGKKGRWSLVKDLNTKKEGWVFDYYLALTTKFRVSDKWKIKEIKFVIGDTLTKISCSQNGTFVCDYISSYKDEDKDENHNIQGSIMIYNNILWFKKKRKDDNFPLIFYYDANGKIQIENYYSNRSDEVDLMIKYY